MQKLILARKLALEWHDGQMYGDKPYIYHLDSTVAFLTEQMKGQDLEEDILVIGMLHDILEGTACPEHTVYGKFGTYVGALVETLTKRDGQSYEDYIYIVKGSPGARVVKRADTFSNLRESLLKQDLRRVKKYARQLELLS